MGKYMRKAKITTDVAVMEIPQSILGVRTRARTLALQRLQSSSAAAPSQPSNPSDSSCYLELRSRRLEKPSLLKPLPQKLIPQKQSCKQDSETNSNPRSSSRLRPGDSANSVSVPAGSGSITRSKKDEGCFESRLADDTEHNFDLGVEASFGENNLDFEARSTRESTPCSLIRDVDVVTPGSSTRQMNLNAGSQRTRNAILRSIPSAYEMEEFFNHAEQQQRQQFVEKYNFDITSDMPLPGRYDWEKAHRAVQLPIRIEPEKIHHLVKEDIDRNRDILRAGQITATLS